MEIDQAIKGCDEPRLKTKYNDAIYVIQRALALYAIEEVAFSFNGGKDSTVLLHLLRAAYFLYKKEGNYCCDGDPAARGLQFPIRTIYFESPSAFPEINSFTHDTAAAYGLHLDIIRQDFKSGLEAMLKDNPIRAIFLGVRIGDPTAVGQEQFSPSSPGWPPFMRVNPILDWSYRDVWAFLLKCKVPYCGLYDQGYTSIGSIYDTVPNARLCTGDSTISKQEYKPAYQLSDGRLERAGRAKKPAPQVFSKPSENGIINVETEVKPIPTASVIGVGDEILSGAVEDLLGSSLCKKLHHIGWTVSQLNVVQNDIDSVAEMIEKLKSGNDMVFIHGGVGPLQSDVTLSGVAKAFGVRLAPDEEFEECLNRIVGYQCTGGRNEMAQLPEGITELLHHANLTLPLMKCQNVIILGAANLSELDKEWQCLMELARSSNLLLMTEPYVSRRLSTTLSDIEAAQPLLALNIEFPDLYIGCYRKSRAGPLLITIEGKEVSRVQEAMESLCRKSKLGIFSEIQ